MQILIDVLYMFTVEVENAWREVTCCPADVDGASGGAMWLWGLMVGWDSTADVRE